MTIETDPMAKARAAKAAKAAAKDEPKETVEEKRSRLLNELAELPPAATAPAGARPGSKIGEGVQSQYVDFTEAWFLDVDARRKDRVNPNDPASPLMWPNYSLHEVVATKTEDIRINGVGFRVIGGVPCKLPDPFYTQYIEALKAKRKNDEQFAPPEKPGKEAGYMSPVFKMGNGPLTPHEDNA